MTDLLEEKVVKKIQVWNDDLSKIQDIFSEFSKSITDYDRESDADERKNKLEKITELHDKIIEELDIMGDDVGVKYDVLKDGLQSKYDNLLEKYENAQGSGYFNFGDRDGKKAREEIKKLFKLSKENLSNTNLNNRVVDKLDALNDYIEKVMATFGPKGILVNLHEQVENRARQMSRIVAEKPSDTPFKTPFSTPSKTPKKGKIPDFSPMPLPLDPEDKKEIEKMIENPEMKAQIVNKIMKAFPSSKRIN